MAFAESRPGLVERTATKIGDFFFGLFRGLPRELYDEGEELQRQAQAVETGEITDPEAIEAVKSGYRQWFERVDNFRETGRTDI